MSISAEKESSAEALASTQNASPSVDEAVDEYARHAGWDYRIARRMALWFASFYGALYDGQMQRGGVRAENQRLQLAKYPIGAPPLKAAFLSDLHYGPISGKVAPAQAWKIAREAKPDILFLGGDFLYADCRGLPALLRELLIWKKNPPSAGMFACLGNHDYLLGAETITTCLEACGVRVLVNEAVPLPEPWQDVWIAGSDECVYGEPDPASTMAEVPRESCTILLAHEPDICETNLPAQCSLTLCGHTHGGQICFPNGKPVMMGSKWGRDYLAGPYRHAGRWVYVSRGIGAVVLPLRLWAPPEVTLLELSGQNRGSAVRVVGAS